MFALQPETAIESVRLLRSLPDACGSQGDAMQEVSVVHAASRGSSGSV